jgi:hypothetical protein
MQSIPPPVQRYGAVYKAGNMRLHPFIALKILRQPVKVFQMRPCL